MDPYWKSRTARRSMRTAPMKRMAITIAASSRLREPKPFRSSAVTGAEKREVGEDLHDEGVRVGDDQG